MDNEDRNGLKAVLNLVKDSQTCLDQAIAELRLRNLGRFGWAMGSIGAARSATKFAASMIEAFIRPDGAPKKLGTGT